MGAGGASFGQTVTRTHDGQTADAMRRMALDAARGVHEVLSGIEPTWPVN